jgi:hypothetical protein
MEVPVDLPGVGDRLAAAECGMIDSAPERNRRAQKRRAGYTDPPDAGEFIGCRLGQFGQRRVGAHQSVDQAPVRLHAQEQTQQVGVREQLHSKPRAALTRPLLLDARKRHAHKASRMPGEKLSNSGMNVAGGVKPRVAAESWSFSPRNLPFRWQHADRRDRTPSPRRA